MRFFASRKAASTAALKRCCSWGSRVNACTVVMAFNTSPAMALVSATLSWLVRDIFRTRRPSAQSGKTMTASRIIMMPANQALVTSIMVMPPINITKLRSAIEMLDPTKVCTKVVSLVKRDNTSPVCRVSK